MRLCIAARLLELANICGHQRAFAVVKKLTVCGIEGKRVEAACEGFVVTHGAAVVAQVFAVFFNADTAQFLFFNTGQADFEGRMSIVNGAATLALRTVVKQHGDPW